MFIFLDKYIGVELLDHRVDALKKKKSYPQRETKKLLEVIDVCYIDCDNNLTDVSVQFQFSRSVMSAQTHQIVYIKHMHFLHINCNSIKLLF